MIASLLTLTRQECERLAIKDPYSIHRVIYDLFPKIDGQTRSFLFRDKGGDFNSRHILILSDLEPRQPEIGKLEMRNIPDRFLDFSNYGFDVLVNPVYRENKSGKIIPIRGKDALTEWFVRKAPTYGFTVYPESIAVSETDVLRFEKKGEQVVLGKARFVGKLRVQDAKQFKMTFRHGLGRAKTFGFGLLELVPLQEASEDA
jgi:CRISPR system Cascade subunit CasE